MCSSVLLYKAEQQQDSCRLACAWSTRCILIPLQHSSSTDCCAAWDVPAQLQVVCGRISCHRSRRRAFTTGQHSIQTTHPQCGVSLQHTACSTPSSALLLSICLQKTLCSTASSKQYGMHQPSTSGHHSCLYCTLTQMHQQLYLLGGLNLRFSQYACSTFKHFVTTITTTTTPVCLQRL